MLEQKCDRVSNKRQHLFNMNNEQVNNLQDSTSWEKTKTFLRGVRVIVFFCMLILTPCTFSWEGRWFLGVFWCLITTEYVFARLAATSSGSEWCGIWEILHTSPPKKKNTEKLTQNWSFFQPNLKRVISIFTDVYILFYFFVFWRVNFWVKLWDSGMVCRYGYMFGVPWYCWWCWWDNTGDDRAEEKDVCNDN